MLIRKTDWELIREHFSEAEKQLLNEAITGETICPRGVVIDDAKAGSVGAKIRQLLLNLKTKL